MEKKVEVTFLENDKFQVKAEGSGTSLCVDKTAPDYESQGPNPLELFLASLGTCIGVFAKKYLNRHNIEFTDLRIEVKADFTQTSPMRLIDIEAKVYTDAKLGDKREVFLKFVENCPVHNTILNTDTLKVSLH